MKLICDNVSGWGCLDFQDAVISFSYTTDFAQDVLFAAIHSLKNDTPFCIKMDGESKGEYILISDDYDAYLLYDSEFRKEMFTLEKDNDKLSLIEEIIDEIENNIHDWVMFPCGSDEYNTDQIRARESVFRRDINYIRFLLNKNRHF